MSRVVIFSSFQSDSTETEESSDFEAYYPPAEESSNGFGGFAHQLFADPSGFPSHLPVSPGPDSPSFSPLGRGPSEFEDVELFPSQPSILKESDLSLVRLLLGPSAELSPNSFRFVATFLSLCDSLSVPPTLSLFTQLFYVAAVGSRLPGSIQIVLREGLRFDGINKSCKRWKERFVFVRPAGGHLIFLLLGLLITLSLTGCLRRLGVSPASSGFPRPRSGAGDRLYRTGSFRERWAITYGRYGYWWLWFGDPISYAISVGPSAPISSRGAISYEMASQHDVLREQFRRLTRSHTARSAALPPLPTKGPGDKGKKPVDEPSAPPAFASSPPCALADSETLRKRARAEPAEEELSGLLLQPLTLAVTGWTDSSMCGTRFNYDPLEWAEKVVFPRDQEHMQTISDEALHRRTVANLYGAVAAVSANRRRSRERSQELEEFNARFSDLTVRYQDQVEASRRSLTTQAELRRARQEAEEGRRVAEESLLSAVSDYQNSDKFRQDALASIRGASDDFALIGKDWLASPEGVQYAPGMSLEDFYEGSRQMQQEIYATLQSSNPPFMPADLGLPPPLPSWADRHLNEGPGSPILGSGVASKAHPPGFALSSGSGGRRQIPFDHAYLNSAANLQVLADFSNAEISLGPLDSVDGAGPQDVRGDVSSRAPGV
nr:uncharacterized protein LOC109192107 [Ipomoea trifida]